MISFTSIVPGEEHRGEDEKEDRRGGGGGGGGGEGGEVGLEGKRNVGRGE